MVDLLGLHVHSDPLFLACNVRSRSKKYNYSLLESLILHGHNVNATFKGMTPLFGAVHTVKTLDGEEFIPLELLLNICERHHISIDANFVTEDDWEDTILLHLMRQWYLRSFGHYCAPLSISAVCRIIHKLVYSFNANPNTPNTKGETPLGWAIYEPTLLAHLLDCGARLSSPHTLFDVIMYRREESLKLLMQKGAVKLDLSRFSSEVVNIWTEIVRVYPISETMNLNSNLEPFGPNDDSLFQYLLDCGFDANAKTEGGHNALAHLCNGTCTESKLRLMRFLIANGAKMNKEDNNGHIALRYAVQSGCLERVKLLVDSGAIIPHELLRQGFLDYAKKMPKVFDIEKMQNCISYLDKNITRQKNGILHGLSST